MDPETYPQGNTFEVACELRFAGGKIPVGALLPGLLFTTLQGDFDQIETLPSAAIPDEMRRDNPQLKYLPTHRLSKEGGYVVSIGDRVITVSNLKPYAGWEKLRNASMKVFEVSHRTSLLGVIERISVRYANLFPADPGSDQLGFLNAEIRLGNLSVSSESMMLRLESKEDNFHAVTTLQSNTNVKSELPWGGEGEGLLLQFDLIITKSHESLDDVLESLERCHARANVLYREVVGGKS